MAPSEVKPGYRKLAVIDSGEVYLYAFPPRSELGVHGLGIELEWESTWPQYVKSDFLKSQGFTVVTA